MGRDFSIWWLALTHGQPTQLVQRDQRRVEIWDVPSLRFSDSYTEPVRVVRVGERWIQRARKGKEWKTQRKEQNWIWVVAGDLDVYDVAAIRGWGHLRWNIENNAFGEFTQHWHLTHCAHHQPVAVACLLWLKIIAFTLFHAFAILHGKLLRLGKVTLQELRQRIYRSLLSGCSVQCFSGSQTTDSSKITSGGLEGFFAFSSERQTIGTQEVALEKNRAPAPPYKGGGFCEIDALNALDFATLGF